MEPIPCFLLSIPSLNFVPSSFEAESVDPIHQGPYSQSAALIWVLLQKSGD